MNRRHFNLGLATLAAATPAGAQTPPMRIDTHAHIFERGLKLAANIRYSPDYDAKVGDYLAQLDANGMTHGVLVQPSFLGTDNSYLLAGLAAGKGRLRGIAVVDPALPPEDIAAMANAGVVGIRLNLVGLPIPDFSAAPWPKLLGQLVEWNWQVEVQRKMADLPQVLTPLLGAGVTVVVDHFGLPDQTLGDKDPALEFLLAQGKTRRVYCKVSAPYRSGKDGEGIGKALYPRLRDALGADRLLWGSDWPHTGFEKVQSYAQNRAFLDAMVRDEKERAAILGANAAGLFRFGG